MALAVVAVESAARTALLVRKLLKTVVWSKEKRVRGRWKAEVGESARAQHTIRRTVSPSPRCLPTIPPLPLPPTSPAARTVSRPFLVNRRTRLHNVGGVGAGGLVAGCAVAQHSIGRGGTCINCNATPKAQCLLYVDLMLVLLLFCLSRAGE